MQFFKASSFNKRNLNKDLLGVLLMLAIGIGGQIFVLNPVGILVPEHPMISPRDWPGSHEVSDLEFSNRWQWEKRELTVRLQTLDYDSLHSGAEIWQRAVWYANPAEAAQAWEGRDSRQFSSFAK